MSASTTSCEVHGMGCTAVAEGHFVTLLRICLLAVAAVVAANIGVAVWARHEFTQVESIVALHSTMFASGRGLYYGLNNYPFTVSSYGPVFHLLSVCLHRFGMPLLLAGRLISVAALLSEWWIAWRILGLLLSNRCAIMTGLLLAGATWNTMTWGTVGQTDTLACCLSLAAFWKFLTWREDRKPMHLVAAGLLVILSVMTKQTAVAAAFSIALCLIVEDRKIAVKWIASLSVTSAIAVLALNAATHGHYYQDAVLANINPLRLSKFVRQLEFFFATSAGLLVIAVAGFRYASRRQRPLFLYAGLAACVWLATCAKIGSDANYQIEIDFLIALCAACTLDATGCFPKLFASNNLQPAVLLLPLAANVCLSVFLSAKTLGDRIHTEPLEAARDAQIAPYLQAAAGPVISVEFGPLLQACGRIDVEPLIFAYLVRAGRVDPTPVLHDLEARTFSTVVLYRDVSAPPASPEDEETLSLTDAQMNALRTKYRLVKHVNSPYLNGDFIYQPRPD